MIVDRRVIIELKAVSALATIHEVQLVNYLTATGIDDGLLINFGSKKLEIRRKFRLYKKV
jgi:GxxExxY protein